MIERAATDRLLTNLLANHPPHLLAHWLQNGFHLHFEPDPQDIATIARILAGEPLNNISGKPEAGRNVGSTPVT